MMENIRGSLQRFGPWIRVVVCLALLSFLFFKLDMTSLVQAARHVSAHWVWLIVGLGMTFLGLMAGAVRWKVILDTQGIHLSTAATLRIYFIGQFFNAFLLGACGGDVARAYYVARGQTGRRAEAAATIIVDRAIGLFCTILFACVMILIRMHVFLDHTGPRDTGFMMIFFLLAAMLAVVALFSKNVFEHFRFFQAIENTTRIGPLIRRAYDVFFLCRKKHRMLATSAALSMASLVFLTLACWDFGQALELDVELLDYLALFPVITVLMSVPLTPGALGVRESLFVSLFRSVMVDKPHALVMSLLVYAGGLFWSLVGGALYLGIGSKDEHPLHSDIGPWSEDIGSSDEPTKSAKDTQKRKT